MIPIKFRQPLWDEHNNFYKWHYWGFINNTFVEPEYEPYSSIEEAAEQSQQFAGLHDKNGNEIYATDIIIGEIDGVKHKFVVEWSDKYLCWEVVDTKKQSVPLYILEKIEVIGSIHENPELLEKANAD